MQIQIEMLGVYGVWQNEGKIISDVYLHRFTSYLGLLNGGKKKDRRREWINRRYR